MRLVRIGRQVVNLDYLVAAHDASGTVRLTMVRSEVLELDDAESAELRALLAELLPPRDAPATDPPAAGGSWRDRPPML